MTSKINLIIRHNCFESNSSSAHTISLNSSTKLYDSLTPDENGAITLTGGEFGWDWFKHNDVLTKANYAAVAAQSNGKEDWLVEVIKEHTGAKNVIFNLNTDNWQAENISYIDHQSLDDRGKAVDQIFQSKENLKQFIFSPDSWLFGGNDNGYPPPNFYDPVGTKYTHKLKLDGTENFYLLKDGERLSREKVYEFLRVLWEENRNNEYYRDDNWKANFFTKETKGYKWPSWSSEEKLSWNFEKGEIYPAIEEPTYSKGKDAKFLGYELIKQITLKFNITEYEK